MTPIEKMHRDLAALEQASDAVSESIGYHGLSDRALGAVNDTVERGVSAIVSRAVEEIMTEKLRKEK